MISRFTKRLKSSLILSILPLFSMATSIQPPSSPSCSSGNFLWENPTTVSGSTVTTGLRFIDGQTTSFKIPNLPSEFSSAVDIEIAEAVSWDGYSNRVNVTQYYEQWKLVFFKNGSIVYESPYTGDVADKQVSGEWKGSLGGVQSFPNGVDSILIVHIEDPINGSGSKSSANSVVPTSVCFDYTSKDDCTAGVSDPCILVQGVGAKNCSSKWLTSTENVSNIDKIVVELIYKGSKPTSGYFKNGSDQIYLNSSTLKSFNNNSSTGYEGFYRATFNNPTSNATKFYTTSNNSSLVSYVAYVYLKSSACANNNSELNDDMFDIYHSSHTTTYTIPSTVSSKTIQLVSPISELTNDSRVANVTLTAGSQSATWSENTYSNGQSVNFADLELSSVPGNVTSVTVTYQSPNSNGDSYYNGQGALNWFEHCPTEEVTLCGAKEFCIKSSKVSGSSDLDDFPVFVSYTHADLKSVSNGGKVENTSGSDIAFTSTNNDLYSFEMMSYNPSTGKVEAWVKIPAVSSSTNTCFLLQYGDEDLTTSYSTPNTWTSDYASIYHFENYQDATPNGNDGVNNGSTLSSAIMGNGVCLDGSNDYVFVGDDNSLDFGGKEITMSAWVKIKAPHSVDAAVAVKGTTTNQEYYMLGVDGGTNPIKINTRVSTSSGHYRHDEGTLPNNTWAYLTFVYDGNLGSNQKKTYLNGVLVADQSGYGNINTGSGDLLIGKRTDGRYLKGCIDELRINSTAKSVDWILTEYRNQSDPSSFYTVSDKLICIPVPVKLISLEGKRVGDVGVINWSTASEINNDYFEVERRLEGESEYSYIGMVEGNGNSNSINNYEFIDINNPWNTKVSYYRLRQVDFDGAFEYHGDVAITNSNDIQARIYPNPTKDKTTVVLASNASTSNAVITLYDLYGRNVTSDAVINQKGESIAMDVASLRNGTYIVHIFVNGSITSQKFSVTR